MKLCSRVTALLLSLALTASPAIADVVYTYTGAALDVTTTSGGATALPTQITAELVAPAPILGGTDPLGAPLIYSLSQFTSWSFSDGLATITNQTPPDRLLSVSSGFEFSSAGQIQSWFVSLNEAPISVTGTLSIIETIGDVRPGPQGCLAPVGLPPGCYADDGQSYFEVPPPGIGATGAIAATQARGLWSGPQAVGVPEPRTLLLTLLGLVLLVCVHGIPALRSLKA